MNMDQRTQLYGVAGYPLGHTLSPLMQNLAFSLRGINAVYLAFETRDIEGALRGMKALGIQGMSITIPHKSSVIPFLDGMDPLAEKIGAVNTIVNRGGRLTGYNTDASGARKALEKATALTEKACLVVGAGGAARAIAFMLKEQKARVTITNRTGERGQGLAHDVGCPFIPMEAMSAVHADVLVQTTPVGMHPREDQSVIPPECLKPGMVVMDIVYNPVFTRLLSMAESAGCTTVNGLGMFVGQGAEQFELWTGQDAPVEAMTAAVAKALGSGS